MPLGVLKEIGKIYSGLNPDGIREEAQKQLSIGLISQSEAGFERLERFLAPAWLDEQSRTAALASIRRIEGDWQSAAPNFDFILGDPGTPLPKGAHALNVHEPASTIREIAASHDSIELALGRALPHFREPLAQALVQRVSKENALVALVTALPNVVPSFLDLPWALGEFATDTAVLTMNQIRLALMLAALHGNEVGYQEQMVQIGAIAGGAFGWRALAREMVGKMPFGMGLIPKAAVAFAGTWLVGMGLERVNRTGSHLTRKEKKEAYSDGLGRGKEVARDLVPAFNRTAAT